MGKIIVLSSNTKIMPKKDAIRIFKICMAEHQAKATLIKTKKTTKESLLRLFQVLEICKPYIPEKSSNENKLGIFWWIVLLINRTWEDSANNISKMTAKKSNINYPAVFKAFSVASAVISLLALFAVPIISWLFFSPKIAKDYSEYFLFGGISMGISVLSYVSSMLISSKGFLRMGKKYFLEMDQVARAIQLLQSKCYNINNFNAPTIEKITYEVVVGKIKNALKSATS